MDTLSVSDLLSSIWGIALVALFFGGSIFVHELGHFLAARRRGLKVERFSIGFGPKVIGWTGKDGVDYRISLIPLGGYVALPQLAEMEGIEGPAAEGAEELPKISYADKMIVSVMGAVFNVIFAFTLACVLWFTGTPVAEGSRSTVVGYVPETVVTGAGHLAELGLGRTEPGPAFVAGIRAGDRIIAVDGQPVTTFNPGGDHAGQPSGRRPPAGGLAHGALSVGLDSPRGGSPARARGTEPPQRGQRAHHRRAARLPGAGRRPGARFARGPGRDAPRGPRAHGRRARDRKFLGIQGGAAQGRRHRPAHRAGAR
jgi:hypothetical protein